MEFSTEPTRLPAALWESLQEICWRQDNKFLEDAARILNIPTLEIKRRVLGTRGVVSAVVSTNRSWYEGSCCPIMIPCPGEMWRRCSEPAESNGYCWAHKKGRGMRHDCEFFAKLPTRHPWRFEGVVVWVGEDGSVLMESGTILKDVRIDIKNGICFDDRPVPPAWTKAELASEASVEDEADDF